MQPLYLFNPESDLAVAINTPHYVPPRHAMAIGEDLALLPIWFAPPTAAVWVTDADRDAAWMATQRQALGMSHTLYTTAQLPTIAPHIDPFVPWGWSIALLNHASKSGIPSHLLPPQSQLEAVRQLAHRSHTILLLQALQQQGVDTPHQHPIELHSECEVEAFVTSQPQLLLKAPWSGSGKGLYWGRGEYDTPLAQWSRGILKRQGSLLGEYHFDKVQDFAMEFYSDGAGEVHFAGYSLFHTNPKGVYGGNDLRSNSDIEQQLLSLHPQAQLPQLKQLLPQLLAQQLPHGYRGYLGVDMMLYRNTGEGTIALHPCIELNLRMNMGMLSRLLFDRYIAPTSQGSFSIDFEKDPHTLCESHAALQERHPLIIEQGRIVSGYLSLAPITPTTHYRARVEVSALGFTPLQRQ